MELLFRGARLSVPGAFEREGHDGERGIYPLLRAHRVEVIAIGFRAPQTQFAALVEVAEQRDVRPADRLAVLALPRQIGGHCEQIGGSGVFRDLLAQRLARLGLFRRLLANLKPSHKLRRAEDPPNSFLSSRTMNSFMCLIQRAIVDSRSTSGWYSGRARMSSILAR